MASIVQIPEKLEAISNDILEQLITLHQPPPEMVGKPASNSRNPNKRLSSGWDETSLQKLIDEKLSKYGPSEPHPFEGGIKWQFKVCPFNPAHDKTAAGILWSPEKGPGFHCFHNGCKDHHWKEFTRLIGKEVKEFEPVYFEPPSWYWVQDVHGNFHKVDLHGLTLRLKRAGYSYGVVL